MLASPAGLMPAGATCTPAAAAHRRCCRRRSLLDLLLLSPPTQPAGAMARRLSIGDLPDDLLGRIMARRRSIADLPDDLLGRIMYSVVLNNDS